MTAKEIPLWRTDALPGRLGGILTDALGAEVAVHDLHRFTAGMSWSTIGFVAKTETGERDLILRVGDRRGMLAPYRAEIEFRLLKALQGTPRLPVPRPVVFSDEPLDLGDPFLVTEKVPGSTLLPTWGGAYDDSRLREAAELLDDFVDALVAIHAHDYRSSGLASLLPDVPPDRAILAEIDRMTALATGEGTPLHPAMHFTGRWLRHHAPEPYEVCLLHGDYRVGNFLNEGSIITGILDWELMQLGDPLSDIAWTGLRAMGGDERLLGGLFDRQEFLRRYAERSGRRIDPDRLRYFEVLAAYKMLAINYAASRRVRAGEVSDIRTAIVALQSAATHMGMLSQVKAAL